jgi:hypothetical protein
VRQSAPTARVLAAMSSRAATSMTLMYSASFRNRIILSRRSP